MFIGYLLAPSTGYKEQFQGPALVKHQPTIHTLSGLDFPPLRNPLHHPDS